MWEFLDVPLENSSEQVDLTDLRRKVTPQEELHERYEQVPPPWLPDVERRSVVAEVLPPPQLSRETPWPWLLSHLEQLLVLLQRRPRLEELVEELRKEFQWRHGSRALVPRV